MKTLKLSSEVGIAVEHLCTSLPLLLVDELKQLHQ
jgi:hypothetical protein